MVLISKIAERILDNLLDAGILRLYKRLDCLIILRFLVEYK